MSWIEATSPIYFPLLNLKINPPLGVVLGSLQIRFYGVLIALGLMLAVIYACKRSKKFGLREDDLIDGILWIVPLAIVCARLYYCIFQWKYYKDNLWNILKIWEGGLAIYGGVIGAALGIVVFSFIKRNKVKLTAVLDLVALGFLIGQFVGRWGNFINREAFGAETDSFLKMGLMMTPEGYRSDTLRFYHPTFLYESMWNVAGFLLLHFLSKKRKYDGQIALGYVAWYGLGRTLIEGLRTDSLYWGPVRVSQMLAAVTCFAAVVVLVIMMFKNHDPRKLFVNQVADREAVLTEEDGEEVPEEATQEVAEETAQQEEISNE